MKTFAIMLIAKAIIGLVGYLTFGPDSLYLLGATWILTTVTTAYATIAIQRWNAEQAAAEKAHQKKVEHARKIQKAAEVEAELATCDMTVDDLVKITKGKKGKSRK